MEQLVKLKHSNEIEYEVTIEDDTAITDSYSIPKFENDFINNQLKQIDDKIDFLTCNADHFDYILAACSGILTATLDAILKEKRINNILGSESLDKTILDYFNTSGSQVINDKMTELAKDNKIKKKVEKSIKADNSTVKTTKIPNDSLEGLITFLEKRFNLPSDSLTNKFGGSKQHHLRDFAHHPSIVGFLCSMFTQFTSPNKCIGTDTNGKLTVIELEFIKGKKGKIAKAGKEIRIIGESFGEKITIGTTVWFYHLVSDMAGSSSTPGAGMGIPGPLMSFAKELSALPIFRNKDNKNELSIALSKMYNGTMFAERDEKGKIIEAKKVDFRTEAGLFQELKEQAVPVLFNEFIVRGFYFIRHLFTEIKEKNIKSLSELNRLEPNKILPAGNRTIVRMITVASGTFEATNLAVAAAISAAKSGANPAIFAKQFIMRINFVGIGRFVIAIGTDITQGIKKTQLENKYYSILLAKSTENTSRIEQQHINLTYDLRSALTAETDQRIEKLINYLGE